MKGFSLSRRGGLDAGMPPSVVGTFSYSFNRRFVSCFPGLLVNGKGEMPDLKKFAKTVMNRMCFQDGLGFETPQP